MPFTAFHVVPVWPLYVRWPRRWDLLALSFGAVMPDLEIVTAGPLSNWVLGRGIMHSLLGVVTVNLLLAAFAARVLGPWLATALDRRFPGKGWRTFAGHDVVRDRKSIPVLVASAIVGGLSHLGIDLLHHIDTPLLWPWREAAFRIGPWATSSTIGGIEDVADIVANVVAGSLFVLMVVRWVRK